MGDLGLNQSKLGPLDAGEIVGLEDKKRGWGGTNQAEFIEVSSQFESVGQVDLFRWRSKVVRGQWRGKRRKDSKVCQRIERAKLISKPARKENHTRSSKQGCKNQGKRPFLGIFSSKSKTRCKSPASKNPSDGGKIKTKQSRVRGASVKG